MCGKTAGSWNQYCYTIGTPKMWRTLYRKFFHFPKNEKYEVYSGTSLDQTIGCFSAQLQTIGFAIHFRCNPTESSATRLANYTYVYRNNSHLSVSDICWPIDLLSSGVYVWWHMLSLAAFEHFDDLFMIGRQRCDRIDDGKFIRSGEGVHQIAAIALSDQMQNTAFVQICQLSKIFATI